MVVCAIKAKIVHKALVLGLVFLMAAAILPAKPVLAQTVCLQVDGEGLANGAPIPDWNLIFGGLPAIATVTATSNPVGIHSGDRGVRVNGDYESGKELDIVAKGIVTVDYWHYPKPGASTNSMFSLYGGNYPDHWGILTLNKNDQDLWFISDGLAPPAVVSYSGQYTHIVITINTNTGLFDVNFDEQLVHQGIVGNADKIGASGIRYVGVHSGRGGVGTDSYFDNILITSLEEPPTSDDHPEWPNATSISVPSTTSGIIDPQEDRDWFKFPVQEGSNYRALVVPSSLSEGYVRAYRQNGAEIGSSSSGDFSWTAPSNEDNYVEVWGGGSTRTGSYQLELTSSDGGTIGQPLQLTESGSSISPASVVSGTGGRLTVTFKIYNPNSSSVTTGLGFSVAPSGSSSWIDDPSHDKTVSASPGTTTHTRYFDVPSLVSAGTHTTWYAIKDGGMTGPNFDDFQRNDLTVTPPTTQPLQLTESGSSISPASVVSGTGGRLTVTFKIYL